MRVGIRREDKNEWERRVPLTPAAVGSLVASGKAEVLVQPSPARVFGDEEYLRAGARVEEELSRADIVFAVKEIPAGMIDEGRCYFFFSHTIKGQPYNMPLLRRMMERGITLVDYECIADDAGRRLVFFGRHAGYAGMIDTLQAYGARMRWEGEESVFSDIRSAYRYTSLEHAREEIGAIGRRLNGASAERCPIVVGITGYGNVSQGAQSILDLFPCEEITPGRLLSSNLRDTLRGDRVYKVVFYEEDMFERGDGGDFVLQDYLDHPEDHVSVFDRFLPHLTMLVNGIFWDERCPRLVTKRFLRDAWTAGELERLKVIGDISIDIEGSIECSAKATESDNPCYVYDPVGGGISDGVGGDGPVIMAVDNLPCEIPRESSETFSKALLPLLPEIVGADWSAPFDELDIPAQIERAVILHKGELTPRFLFMKDFL
ncbi:MAG: hypothetical protein CME06_14425 [Gemmatimonadetes bacterium]|nr:hypothetical protein [Gemmatimonadota bacterium]